METLFKDAMWSQFGAAIDMLQTAIQACPESLWIDDSRQPQFWYLVYHTLFWLDLYLSESPEDFRPPPPFTLDEMKPDGQMRAQPYTRTEMLSYLEHGREKCRQAVESMQVEQAGRVYRFGWGEAPYAELLIYNLRHVQHGVAQLNLLLRQSINAAPEWVAKAGTRGS